MCIIVPNSRLGGILHPRRQLRANAGQNLYYADDHCRSSNTMSELEQLNETKQQEVPEDRRSYRALGCDGAALLE